MCPTVDGYGTILLRNVSRRIAATAGRRLPGQEVDRGRCNDGEAGEVSDH